MKVLIDSENVQSTFILVIVLSLIDSLRVGHRREDGEGTERRRGVDPVTTRLSTHD